MKLVFKDNKRAIETAREMGLKIEHGRVIIPELQLEEFSGRCGGMQVQWDHATERDEYINKHGGR